MRRRLLVALLVLHAAAALARERDRAVGRAVYAARCASCHGATGKPPEDGRGLPDFTDCHESTGPSADWEGLVRKGGPFLGMSGEMPAFGGALSDDEIADVVSYIQSLCPDPRYPPADLNFADPLFVSNAFPEDENILVTSYESRRHADEGRAELFLQKRIGARGQLGVMVPAGVDDGELRSRQAGVGDVRVAYRHALWVAQKWHSLAAAGVELGTPTGSRRHGIGQGTFVGAADLFSGHGLGPIVVQTNVRAELPVDPHRAPRQMRYRFAVQYPLGPYARDPVPAVEFEQTQAIASDAHTATLLAPTFILPLSRRGHVALGVGAQFPVAGSRPFDARAALELYWVYAEGPIWAW
jgi:mono/diheme cytochrome c family protein